MAAEREPHALHPRNHWALSTEMRWDSVHGFCIVINKLSSINFRGLSSCLASCDRSLFSTGGFSLPRRQRFDIETSPWKITVLELVVCLVNNQLWCGEHHVTKNINKKLTSLRWLSFQEKYYCVVTYAAAEVKSVTKNRHGDHFWSVYEVNVSSFFFNYFNDLFDLQQRSKFNLAACSVWGGYLKKIQR